MKRVALLVLFIWVSGCMHASLMAQGSTSALPDGEGKDVVVRMCTGCHALDEVVAKRATEAGWKPIVSDMVALGATGTDEEQRLVAAYLGKYFRDELRRAHGVCLIRAGCGRQHASVRLTMCKLPRAKDDGRQRSRKPCIYSLSHGCGSDECHSKRPAEHAGDTGAG